jgi:hypothetical protein
MATTRENLHAIANTLTPTPTGARLDLRIYLGYEDGHSRITAGDNSMSVPASTTMDTAANLMRILADAEKAARRVARDETTA